MTPNTETSNKFFKVTWHVVAAVNREREVSLLVVPQLEPDYRRTARAQFVRTATSRELPESWSN